MNISEELERLRRLHEEGVLSDEEFAAAKQRVLNDNSPEARPIRSLFAGMRGLIGDTPAAQARFWSTVVHLSLLLGFVIKPFGFAAPVLVWLLFREKFPEVDRHGKNVINFLICWGIAFGLCTVLGGAFTMAAWLFRPVILPLQTGVGAIASVLSVIATVLPIIAAVKAHRGQEWRYPLVYRFLR